MTTKRLIFLTVSVLQLLSVLSSCRTKTSLTTSVSGADNSQTSLDWAGTYQGTTPCRTGEPADCEGIQTVLILNRARMTSLARFVAVSR